MSYWFVEKRIKKTTFEHPFFPFPSFYLYAIFFLQQFQVGVVPILKLFLKIKQQ